MEGSKLWLRGVASYLLASLFLFYEMALQISPSIMTEPLMHDFHIGAALLGALTGIYFYSYTPVQVPVGLLYDRFGPRRLLTIAAFVCSIGSFIFGFSQGVGAAAFGRFFMGLGSAFAFVGVLTVAARWFPTHFALCVGIAQFLASIGALCGALPLAALVNVFGWRKVIITMACIGALIGILCVLVIRDAPPNSERKPLRHRDLLRECRELFKNYQTLWVGLYAFFSAGPVVVFAALWGVPYLMTRYHISNTRAAAAIGMIWIGLALASPLIGHFSDSISRRKPFLLITAATGLVASLSVLYLKQLTFPALFPCLLALGFSSSGQILCFAIVKDINPPLIVSTAMGLNNMAVVAGGALLQPLVGFLISLSWDGEIINRIPIYSVAAYHMGLFVLPLCFLCALLISIFCIKETYCLSQAKA